MSFGWRAKKIRARINKTYSTEELKELSLGLASFMVQDNGYQIWVGWAVKPTLPKLLFWRLKSPPLDEPSNV